MLAPFHQSLTKLPPAAFPAKLPVLKNRLPSKIGPLHDALQPLAEIGRYRVAVMQSILRHRKFRFWIEDDEIGIPARGDLSFARVASREARRLFRHPARQIGQLETSPSRLRPHDRQRHRQA